MAEEKKTTSSTKTTKKTTSKSTTKKSTSSKNAEAERARKEALREEVLALYSKKQGTRAVEENPSDNVVVDELDKDVDANGKGVASSEPTMKNAYTTPFFGTNKVEASSAPSVERKEVQAEVEESASETTKETERVEKIGSFEEFSKSNYGNESLGGFDAGSYVGLSQKPQKTKIISEKSYDRSPRFEKLKRFLSYLFTTKEGWYYILGTLCLVFIIVLFFI